MNPARLVPLVALCLALPRESEAAWKVFGKSKVVFHADATPGALDIEGVTSDLALDDDGTRLLFTVRMDTVETGIALRDDHMRKNFVQTDVHPLLTLEMPRAALSLPAAGATQVTATVNGAFTVRGQAEEVPVTYTMTQEKAGWKIRASFPFDVTKHGIAIPSYLGVTVAPAMTAEVTFRAVDAQPQGTAP